MCRLAPFDSHAAAPNSISTVHSVHGLGTIWRDGALVCLPRSCQSQIGSALPCGLVLCLPCMCCSAQAFRGCYHLVTQIGHSSSTGKVHDTAHFECICYPFQHATALHCMAWGACCVLLRCGYVQASAV